MIRFYIITLNKIIPLNYIALTGNTASKTHIIVTSISGTKNFAKYIIMTAVMQILQPLYAVLTCLCCGVLMFYIFYSTYQ